MQARKDQTDAINHVTSSDGQHHGVEDANLGQSAPVAQTGQSLAKPLAPTATHQGPTMQRYKPAPRVAGGSFADRLASGWNSFRHAATEALKSDDFDENYLQMKENSEEYESVGESTILGLTDSVVGESPGVAAGLFLGLSGVRLSDASKWGPKLLTSGGPRRFVGDGAVQHFEKHSGSVMKAMGRTSYNLRNYLDDANHVITNGTWVPELNGYVSLVGGQGSAKAAFVGIDRAGGHITTFHIKSVSELSRSAPSLGWSP
jgi:hypothetical protein